MHFRDNDFEKTNFKMVLFLKMNEIKQALEVILNFECYYLSLLCVAVTLMIPVVCCPILYIQALIQQISDDLHAYIVAHSEDVLPSIHVDKYYPCELVGTWNTWYGEQDQAGRTLQISTLFIQATEMGGRCYFIRVFCSSRLGFYLPWSF